jgi:hypothetical protein
MTVQAGGKNPFEPLLYGGLFGAASSDYAVDDAVADSDDYMGHHIPEFKFLDLANQMIACGESHDPISRFMAMKRRGAAGS